MRRPDVVNSRDFMETCMECTRIREIFTIEKAAKRSYMVNEIELRV
jgi:hypothetical protein